MDMMEHGGSHMPPDAAQVPSAAAPAIGREQLQELTQILQKYKAGKKHTDARIISAENWWKLRNSAEEEKELSKNDPENPTFKARSGWLHNVIASKHADAMEAYPEAGFLPREQGDKAEAKILSDVMPVIMEQNRFEQTYSKAMWSKIKCGTAVYKVVWDPDKLGGLGDISIEVVNLLNLYWEPGISDIQHSRYVFQTELVDRDILIEQHPELRETLKGQDIISSKFAYDDAVSTENKATVIECYYHKTVNGRRTLQYCKYVGDSVLYATENSELAERGLYDHGDYPFVFDILFPIEGSPCGYGYVDLGKNPQTMVDLLNTSFIKSARMGASPRVFSRLDGNVNEEEYADPNKSVVHVSGALDDLSIKVIPHSTLDGAYLNVAQGAINELRETTGNTDASTGTAPAGVTAASAIAALQEASGKGSRDSTRASYRAFAEVTRLCVELIRQFYDMPRQFRITGEHGIQQFVSYQNNGLQPQMQIGANGQPAGYRLPVLDIKIVAQKKSTYTRIAQNELALQFFGLGFFNPQMADQAVACLEMMDFDGKDELIQKISRNGMLAQKLAMYQQMAMMLAAEAKPELLPQIQVDMAGGAGGMQVPQSMHGSMEMPGEHAANPKESRHMQKAREQSANASQPEK